MGQQKQKIVEYNWFLFEWFQPPKAISISKLQFFSKLRLRFVIFNLTFLCITLSNDIAKTFLVDSTLLNSMMRILKEKSEW